MISLAFALCLSMSFSQDLGFCLRVLDGLLLACQLDLQLLQLSCPPPKGDRQLFCSSSQGFEFAGILRKSELSPASQLPLKTGNFIGCHPEPPFVFIHLPMPAGSMCVVACLGILKLLLKVGDLLRPLPVAVGPSQEPG